MYLATVLSALHIFIHSYNSFKIWYLVTVLSVLHIFIHLYNSFKLWYLVTEPSVLHIFLLITNFIQATLYVIWQQYFLTSIFSYIHLTHSLFDLILYVPSTIFQLNSDVSSWVEPVLSQDKCVLLKDHNAVTPVRLECAARRVLSVLHIFIHSCNSFFKIWYLATVLSVLHTFM